MNDGTKPRKAEVTITVTQGRMIELLEAARDCLLQHCVDREEQNYSAAESHLADLCREITRQVPWKTDVIGVDESGKEERGSA